MVDTYINRNEIKMNDTTHIYKFTPDGTINVDGTKVLDKTFPKPKYSGRVFVWFWASDLNSEQVEALAEQILSSTFRGKYYATQTSLQPGNWWLVEYEARADAPYSDSGVVFSMYLPTVEAVKISQYVNALQTSSPMSALFQVALRNSKQVPVEIVPQYPIKTYTHNKNEGYTIIKAKLLSAAGVVLDTSKDEFFDGVKVDWSRRTYKLPNATRGKIGESAMLLGGFGKQ